MSNETIYHTKITVKPLAKNGGSKFGYNAECKIGSDITKVLKMDVVQFGKTEEEAKDKLLHFLGEDRKEVIF